MPYDSPDKKRAWRKRNSAKSSQQVKDWKKAHPDRVRVYAAKAKAKRVRVAKIALSSDERRKREAMRRAALRLRAIERLGGRCEACGFDDHRAIEFDHREPLLRRTRGLSKNRASCYSSREILELTDPGSIYALLCANCHAIKTRENREYAVPRPIVDADVDDDVHQLVLLQ